MKYLAFYDVVENQSENRNIVLAATNKLKYVLQCIDALKIPCDVLSASGTRGKSTVQKQERKLSPYVTLHLPRSYGHTSVVMRVLDRWQIKWQLLRALWKMPKDEPLIVYHSLFYMNLVKWMKRLKKFPLILDVEEIYGDVIGKPKTAKRELRFFSLADGYIFPTELLHEKINVQSKPCCFIYGTYEVEKDWHQSFDDARIHTVYAGTFAKDKGVSLAIECAEYLDAQYHVHILGFGTEQDTARVKQEIERVASHTACKITYHGLLSGETYIQFIQKCRIGLSTQAPNAQFNNTSFPSKVLSYMANGLRVVSVNMPSLQRSKINDLLFYYEGDHPQAVAEAIRKVDVHDAYDSRQEIKKLDAQFREDFGKMLTNFT